MHAKSPLMIALGTRSVVLVGMMGAGKSALGCRLAARLGIPFVDVDVEIEKAAGMSIQDIFVTHGEAEFRRGEVKVIARLLERGPQVLATGGGAVMDSSTRELIRQMGVSIWIKVELDLLLRRTSRRGDRPLADKIKYLLQVRERFYENSDLTVQSRDEPHEITVSELVVALSDKLGSTTAEGEIRA